VVDSFVCCGETVFTKLAKFVFRLVSIIIDDLFSVSFNLELFRLFILIGVDDNV
jgi:hypothetical protein